MPHHSSCIHDSRWVQVKQLRRVALSNLWLRTHQTWQWLQSSQQQTKNKFSSDRLVNVISTRTYGKPVFIAIGSSDFQWSATSLASGSSGLGAERSAWILNKTVPVGHAVTANYRLEMRIKTGLTRAQQETEWYNVCLEQLCQPKFEWYSYGSAVQDSICLSGCLGKCAQAGRCSDGRFWSGNALWEEP